MSKSAPRPPCTTCQRMRDSLRMALTFRAQKKIKAPVSKEELCPHGTTYKLCKKGCPPWRYHVGQLGSEVLTPSEEQK